MSKTSSFRSDINGLRAVAVLAVLFYHFGVPGFSGGYVGVDVFFVISGFLMTQIICTKLAGNKFKLLDFYAARARRILPALAVVIGMLGLAGYFYLPPLDYKLFGWQALSALTFVSNIVFSHKGDYFDTSSQSAWLLHTWSLSVEWQFYLIFPLLLTGLQRFRRGRWVVPGVIFLFLVSLALSLAMTRWDPTAAFFLLPARGWEMLAGALVFLFGKKISSISYLAFAGLGGILLSVFFYTPEMDFPGFWAALPVLGAALVLCAPVRNRVLDNGLAQFFGNISYSLYLWHWPVIVGARYLDISFTTPHIMIMMGCVVLLSWGSFVLVEAPFRSAKKGAVYALYPLLAVLAWLIFFCQGVPARVPADVRAAEQVSEVKAQKHGKCGVDYKKQAILPECIVGADQIPTAAIWGDSHVNALALSMGEALREAKRSGLLYGYAGCPPILGAIFATKLKKDTCKTINQLTYDKIVSDPHIRNVFLVTRWSLYLQGYNEKGSPHPYVVFDEDATADAGNLAERAKLYTQKMVETMCSLRARKKNVYVLLPVPELGRNVPGLLARSRLLHHRDVSVDIAREDYEARNASVLQAVERAEKECGVHILDPGKYLCGATSCFGVQNGKPLYADDNHLNVAGNALIKPMFIDAFRRY